MNYFCYDTDQIDEFLTMRLFGVNLSRICLITEAPSYACSAVILKSTQWLPAPSTKGEEGGQ